MEPGDGIAAERACAERLTDDGHGADGERKAKAHARAVNGGIHDAVLARVHLGAAENDAVDDDQRQIDTKGLVQAEGVGLHDQLDHGDKARDDDNVARDAYRIGNDLADGGNSHVGQDQNGGRGNAHAEGRDDRGGDRQRRARAEDEDEDGVLLDETLQKVL